MNVDASAANEGGGESLPVVVYSSGEKQHSDGVKRDNVKTVKTYKRRKCLKPSATQTLTEVDINGNCNEFYGGSTSIPQFKNDFQQKNWMCVLEDILESLQSTEGVVRSCIQYLLAHTKESVHGHKNGGLKLPCPSRMKLKGLAGSNAVAANIVGVVAEGSQKLENDRSCVLSSSEKYLRVFKDIIASDKFVSLCSLLHENFKGVRTENLLNFSLIDSRIRSGEYELSNGSFASDIHQTWESFKKIGDEMVHLADSLSKMSQVFNQKKVESSAWVTCTEHKIEEISQIGSKQTGYACRKVPSDPSEQLTKLEENYACGWNKIGTCRECGTRASTLHSLICDGCESMYHTTCVKLVTGEIPIRSWYCLICSADGKNSPQSNWTQNLSTKDPRRSCSVCQRLKASTRQTNGCDKTMKIMTTALSSNSQESWDRGMGVELHERFRKRCNQRLCKRCEDGEREGMEFLVCRHEHCPYKYYHKRCLRSKEIPIRGSVWYCPSCLCRGCLVDRDDDKIILCDGCDEAHHIYCMIPPQTCIPKGDWYCAFCNIEIKMRQKWSGRRALQGIPDGSMDALMFAAEKLHCEEKRKNG